MAIRDTWARAEAALRPPSVSLLPSPQSSWDEGRHPGQSYASGGTTLDAANDSGVRTSTAGRNIDSHRDLTPGARREVVKKSRSLFDNLPFYRAIVTAAVDSSIGWGLKPMPKSDDKTYNRNALAYWKRATQGKGMDVAGKLDYGGLQALVCEQVMVDGEIFPYKCSDGTGRRQRQMFSTEQIGNGLVGGYGPSTNNLAFNWVDGILLDPAMKPLIYRVLLRQLQGTAPLANSVMTFQEIPAAQMLHVYEKRRATRNRGLPWGYCGMNDMIDAMDIKVFELIAHKLNAALIASITTPTGAPPGGMDGMLAAMALRPGEGGGSAPKKSKDGVTYLNLNGSMVPLFKAGENLNWFGQGRQVVNVIELANYIFNGVAAGFGMPVQLALGWAGQGGASVRATLEMGGRFSERVQRMMINDMCQPDWEDVIGTGILAYLYPQAFPLVEPLAPPAGLVGWNTVTWRGPKNITVDKARDGNLLLKLMQAGKMTDEEWWVENGEDPTEMPVQCDEEIAENLDRWVNVLKLPAEHFWRRLFGANAMQGSPSPADSGSKDETAAGHLIDQLRALLTQ